MAHRSVPIAASTAALLLLAVACDPDAIAQKALESAAQTQKQVEEIAKVKMPDLNAASLEAAVLIVKGTARSMGLEVVG